MWERGPCFSSCVGWGSCWVDDRFCDLLDHIADTLSLADANRNTSTNVFSNIPKNSTLISNLSWHISCQVGDYIKLERRVVQDPAVGHPTAVVTTAVPHHSPPHHPPPVTTAGSARHADCGSPSSFGLHRVSH